MVAPQRQMGRRVETAALVLVPRMGKERKQVHRSQRPEIRAKRDSSRS